MNPIAVYDGPGAGRIGLPAIQAFLDHAGLPRETVTPETVHTVDITRHAAFWLPGGWAGDYLAQMPRAGKAAVRRLVEDGGAYIGTCAGAYFAADAIRWEGDEVIYDLNLYRGRAEGSIHAIAPWQSWRPTPLALADHPANGPYRQLEAVYWGGPEFAPDPIQPADVLAVYAATGTAAVITFACGRGRVLLMGPHAELGLNPDNGEWDRSGGHGAQWPWLEHMVRWCLA